MLQLNFKKITLHNFGSYHDTEIDLQNKGFCLVSGINNCPKDNASSNGSGKCFGLGTKILMYDGTVKAVENICPGDLVMGPDSTPRKVLETHTGYDKLYRVAGTKTDNYSYICNGKHEIVLTQTCSFDKFKDLPNELTISVEDFLANKKYPSTFKRYYNQTTTAGVLFNSSDILPIDPYIFGVWLGDGCSYCANICTADTEIKNALSTFAEENNLSIKEYAKKLSNGTTESCIDYHFIKQTYGKGTGRGNSFFKALKHLNVLRNKHIPLIYLTSSIENRLAILAGLLDTDGSLIKRVGRNNSKSYYFEFCQKNDQLANDVVLLARLLGFRTTITKKAGRAYKNGQPISNITYYNRVVISGDISKIPTRIARKQAPQVTQQHTNTLVPNISEVGFGQYYGFITDGDHKFLLADGTIVHNSMIWSGICYALTSETIHGLSKNLKNLHYSDEEMFVELTFEVDDTEYKIKRGENKSKFLSIIKNGTDISGKTYTESLDKFAEELPEINRELVSNIILLGQGLPNKFSSFTPSGRKELLEKLTKSDYMIEDMKTRVTKRLETLSIQLREYDDSLLINGTQLTTAQNNLNNTNDQINKAVKPDYNRAIAESEHKYNEIIKDRDTAKKELADEEQKLEDANKVLLEANNNKAAQLAQLNENYHTSRDVIATNKINVEAQIKILQAEITRLESIKDVCPTCGQKLVGVEKPDTSKQKAELAKLVEHLEKEVKPALVDKDTKYQEYLKQIDGETKDAITSSTNTVNESKRIINNLKNNINDFDHYATLENENLIKLKYDKENWDNWFDNLKKTAAGYEAEIERINKVIIAAEAGKTDISAHLAVVKKMETLIKRDFRGYLLANIIAYIDQKAKEYSETVFGTKELDIYIDGNNLDISYCGKMIDNLSGGEKTRVDLILQLAIRQMLQTYLGFNSNILVLDEITDFLDKQSCSAVMKLLEKELTTIESVFLISHHASELAIPIDTELHIVKDASGISQLSY